MAKTKKYFLIRIIKYTKKTPFLNIWSFLSWEEIFQKYNVINKVNEDGFFIKTADQIKEFREPRLMTKFDSKIDLPTISTDNRLDLT